MEDGSDDVLSSAVISPPINNGEVVGMANFPTAENPAASPLKVNGDSNLAEPEQTQENCENDSSDCDALVIDESVKKPPKKKKTKQQKSEEEFRHSNPYFSESIFELSNLYSNKPRDDEPPQKIVKRVGKGTGKKFRGKNGKPKLREYAQYLGLQPTVQFKCSKCGLTGFQSLQSLNEHLIKCTASAPINTPIPLSNNATNFRVTRKVFLCSACGTYYENWNLFLHMREVHKRFICLYCLGMFPHAEKLSLHLVSKHNCAPAQFETINDFFTAYKDPCFLMCCECQAVFNENENFMNHGCVESAGDQQKESETSKLEEISDLQVEQSSSNNLLSDNNQLTQTTSDNFNGYELDTTSASDIQSNIKITETLKETEESQMSDKDIVEQQDSVKSSYCVDNQESDNSEINMIENENSVEAPSDDRLQNPETPEENIESEEREDPTNLDSSENREDGMDDDGDGDGGDDNKMNDYTDVDQEETDYVETKEVRKVPKVTLKLPKMSSFNLTDQEEQDDDEEYQSEDSEKLMMEIEKESDAEAPSEYQGDNEIEDNEDKPEVSEEDMKQDPAFPTAGSDIAIIELELEQPLDKFDIKLLLQKCLGSTIATCLYCNHARKIAVNGRQLGLHAIAEHRYSAIVKSITAEELIPESFNSRIMECLDELQNLYFNLDSTSSEGGITFSHVFECFQCRYSTTVHKELYLHNRKLHAKAILLCIMCKTSFYSYCELICHLCPGIYALENDVQFRCCLCFSDELPSAFRLMVHLRKKHHVCDVCLEMCHDQSRLSNHVWKHKLHHLCYRCGIAYRNKPDITKHLYWKHGTESVLCKKCLQKKWPHVYHFCIPPTNFPCEECSLSFTRAVSLMVHKRLHTEVYPHTCTEEGCTDKFISKKLLIKHEFKHRQPIEEPKKEEEEVKMEEVPDEVIGETNEQDPENVKLQVEPESEEKPAEKPKPKVDVFDLPELNLSESDSSDSEDEKVKPETPKPEPDNILEPQEETLNTEEEKQESEEKTVPVLENIWDDFKNYQANIAKLDILTDVGKDPEPQVEEPSILSDIPSLLTYEDALRDHDYCAPTMDTLKEQDGLPNSQDLGPDHDYCSANEQKDEKSVKSSIPNNKQKTKGPSSDSSSSDSSSCTCGSNCSCSSGSSNSSSSSSDSSESDSSSEEGRRRQQVRRERRRQKKTKKQSETVNVVDVVATDGVNPPSVTPLDIPIQESDLETTETDTDEDFYDKQPQKLASKLLAEKREKLLQMAGIGPYINGSMIDSRPTTPILTEDVKPKKKSKSKKKKKRKSSKHYLERNADIPNPYSIVPPLSLILPSNSPTLTPVYSPNINNIPVNSNLPMNSSLSNESDSNTRASKRRRVPNKFYGYSSDEEAEKMAQSNPQVFKIRKVDLPTPKSPMIVPPLTIKTAPTTPTVEPISIRMTAKPGEMRVQPLRLPFPKRTLPKIKPMKQPPVLLPQQDQESGSDTNSSSTEDEAVPKLKEQPALYCYCRCPYDEVSEMIGCDSDDCAIEWFHFECVGIMVPPKGQWYCPDCRKKKQQKREMLHAQQMSS